MWKMYNGMSVYIDNYNLPIFNKVVRKTEEAL